jgi:hypothetical protein
LSKLNHRGHGEKRHSPVIPALRLKVPQDHKKLLSP